MTGPDPHLSSEEQQVRRLLAQARHDEPVPEDVAARLDRVLADLRAEDAAESRPATRPTTRPAAVVTDLDARRRRRRVTSGLVAAAAVVVLGVGLAQLDLTSGSDDAGSADSSAAGSTADTQRETTREQATEPGSDAGAALTGPTATLTLAPDTFDRDVRRLLRDAPAESAAQPLAAPGCAGPGRGGTRLAATYDGEAAVLVVRDPVGGVQVIDLYLCGDAAPTRSVRVPVG